MYSLTTSLCYELKDMAEKQDKKFNEAADNFFTYMMANFATEIVVMGAKTALTNFNLPLDASKMKSFDEFHKRFGKYVLSAMEN
jgi:phage FluMu gp28-like protein